MLFLTFCALSIVPLLLLDVAVVVVVLDVVVLLERTTLLVCANTFELDVVKSATRADRVASIRV